MSSALFRNDLSCRDFDELSELTKGWSLDFSQLDPGPSVYQITQVGDERALFSAAYFGASLRQAGDPPPGMITFAVPAKNSSPFVWRGYEIHSNSIMVFTEKTELFSISQPGFQVFTYSYLAKDLAAASRQLGISLPKNFFKQPVAYDCSPESISLVLNSANALSKLYAPSTPSGVVADDSEHSLHYMLHFIAPKALLMAIGVGSESEKLLANKKRKRALQLADTHIREHLHSSLTLKELCETTGVSERTLQYAFLEGFGLSPQQFIKRVRLCEAFKKLRRAKEGDTFIGEVAEELRLSHPGQFAKDYREFFGELPSETLARS